MHRFVILIALFIVSGCTVHNSPKAVVPPSGTVAPRATTAAASGAPASAKFIDRGAETSRIIDRAATPEPNSDDPAIHAWQVSVIEKLKPYMRWPDEAPYYVDTASPTVRVTINRQGLVLRATVVRSSGYGAFDRAARKIFKRAGILPPPPPVMTGATVSFDMAVKFEQ
jgi:TonB family protein